MKKEPDYAVRVEQAIAKKYGEQTVQHPKSNWNDEKEQKYIEHLKYLNKNGHNNFVEEVEFEGVLISKKLLTRESKRSCPVCCVYSFKSNDDVYMSKFDCCEKCYIRWVEDREDRWLTGWRPNNENNNKKN